ncbi:MAG: ammonium transporter [Chloroflexi bacterium]|nr:ammonium transporter [Chloroflexota bacterium]
MIDSGDTAWVLASSALVLLMTPGLAFFYGGLVRQKSAVNTIMLSFITIGLISVQWVLWGFTLGFGPDLGGLGIVGGLEWLGLNGVGGEPGPYSATIPATAYMIFQAMFAIITPALITGAIVERMKFPAFLIFIVLWATLVYGPVAHWVWSFGADGKAAGWLGKLGALDFAGGTVVHINAGVAALAAALVLGRRRGYGREPMPAHNIPFVVLGASLLWFGWFGFNAGSALGANALATNAFVVTNTATAAAALTWTFVSWIHTKRPSVIGAASGAVAGLVAITPASGFVTPLASIAIGIGAGVFCYLAVQLRVKLRFDDALDVWAVHGIGGTWGALATGLFATVAVNALGDNGLFYGNPNQLGEQAIAVAATWVYSFVVTWLILKGIGLFTPLRVKEPEEERGLDVAEHGEPAYTS